MRIINLNYKHTKAKTVDSQLEMDILKFYKTKRLLKIKL